MSEERVRHYPARKVEPCQCGQEHTVCAGCGFRWPCPTCTRGGYEPCPPALHATIKERT